MRVFHFNGNILYQSAEIYDENHKNNSSPDYERYLEKHLRSFTRRRLFRDLLTVYSKLSDLHGRILLDVHGDYRKKRWEFQDRWRRHAVQDWVDRLDGKALALFLLCCNPRNTKIEAKESVVLHASHNIDLGKLARGKVHLRLYVPGEGYVEQDRRRLKNIIEGLEAKIV